jgi:hypothetical protein
MGKKAKNSENHRKEIKTAAEYVTIETASIAYPAAFTAVSAAAPSSVK